MATIRKYENRRLYDTEASRYVNLEELAQRVRAGTDFSVEDAKTGRDLTREILLQILLESPGGPELLPVGMLRRVIRATGSDPVQVMVRQNLGVALEVLHNQLDQLEGQWTRVFFPSKPAATPAAPAPAEPPPEPPPPADEMSELRSRLADLEKRLKKG